jgi:transcription elongation GreA/GreB family factor/very-short-patch-repair endonuclease
MRNLLERGYRVEPQVGALGFRIDMVVEGTDGRRLAVECDGDRFHGPEQWREDMRRQRVLERVGWRFWRCFASSYYRDTEGVIGDLLDTLSRMGIQPVPKGHDAGRRGYFTEHRIVEPKLAETPAAIVVPPLGVVPAQNGIAIGDRIILLFSDDQRRISTRLTEAPHDLEKGLLSITSRLGKAVSGAEEGDEVEFEQDDGRRRKVLIESVEKERTQPAIPTAAVQASSPFISETLRTVA